MKGKTGQPRLKIETGARHAVWPRTGLPFRMSHTMICWGLGGLGFDVRTRCEYVPDEMEEKQERGEERERVQSGARPIWASIRSLT